MPSFIFHNRLVRLSDEEGAMLLVLSDPQHRQRYVGGWSIEETELLGQLLYRRFIKVSLHGTMYALRTKGFAYLEQHANSLLDPLLNEAFEAGRTSRLDATVLADLAEAMQEYGRLVRARYPDFSRGLRQQMVRQYALGLGQRRTTTQAPSEAAATLSFPARPRIGGFTGRRSPVESGPMLTAADIAAVQAEAQPRCEDRGNQDSGSALVDVIDLEVGALHDTLHGSQPLDLLDRVFPDNPEVHYDLESTRRLVERLRTL